MKQSSKRLISIFGSLFLVVAALVIFFDFVQPEYGTIEQIKGQLLAENTLSQTEGQTVASAQKIISEYQQESQSQATLALAMPTSEDVAGALAQLYGVANNNNIAIQSVAVSQPVIEVSTTTPSATKPLGTFSFQISAAGSYESLENFLMGLETNIRVFDVKALSISPASVSSGQKSSAGQDFFNYSLTVATYYQTD